MKAGSFKACERTAAIDEDALRERNCAADYVSRSGR